MLLTGHLGELYCGKFHPDGTYLATSGFDRQICESPGRRADDVNDTPLRKGVQFKVALKSIFKLTFYGLNMVFL